MPPLVAHMLAHDGVEDASGVGFLRQAHQILGQRILHKAEQHDIDLAGEFRRRLADNLIVDVWRRIHQDDAGMPFEVGQELLGDKGMVGFVRRDGERDLPHRLGQRHPSQPVPGEPSAGRDDDLDFRVGHEAHELRGTARQQAPPGDGSQRRYLGMPEDDHHGWRVKLAIHVGPG